MNTKILSIIAVVVGTLCVAFAFLRAYVAMSMIAAIPSIAGSIDDRYFWWLLYAAGVLWALACFGFFSVRKHRRNHAARPATGANAGWSQARQTVPLSAICATIAKLSLEK